MGRSSMEKNVRATLRITCASSKLVTNTASGAAPAESTDIASAASCVKLVRW